jgi:hypothetical protein
LPGLHAIEYGAEDLTMIFDLHQEKSPRYMPGGQGSLDTHVIRVTIPPITVDDCRSLPAQTFEEAL